MSKQIKAILTIIAGTIGVGFLVLPYSIARFGTVWGIGLLIVVGFLTLLTNITYSDIITSDKGNRQIPGYTKKYLGQGWAHMITIVIIAGSLGILLAYGMISGSALQVILKTFDINLSATFLGFVFVLVALFVMKYGMQFIARVSSWSVIALVVAMVLLILICVPNIRLSNVSGLNLNEFPLIFGGSIFAMYSASSIPVIDEIIGYNKAKYRKVIVWATSIILLIYIIFSLVISLSSKNLTSELVDAFADQRLAGFILSILTLLATFTSFVLVANCIQEILNYDYKIPALTATLMFSICLVVLLVLEISDFGTLISLVGNIALALQSLFIFAVWFRSQKRVSVIYRIMVGICCAILLAGMFLQV